MEDHSPLEENMALHQFQGMVLRRVRSNGFLNGFREPTPHIIRRPSKFSRSTFQTWCIFTTKQWDYSNHQNESCSGPHMDSKAIPCKDVPRENRTKFTGFDSDASGDRGVVTRQMALAYSLFIMAQRQKVRWKSASTEGNRQHQWVS